MSNRVQYDQTGVFVNETLPDDFTDILGAFMLGGWNYTFENSAPEEFVNRVVITGWAVTEDGEKDPKVRDVRAVWERRGGEWEALAEETGLYRVLKSGEEKIDPRDTDAMCNYISGRIPSWMWAPITDDAELASEELQEEIIDEEPKSKPRRSRKAKAEESTDAPKATPELTAGPSKS